MGSWGFISLAYGVAAVTLVGYLFGLQIDTASFRLLVEWLASGGMIIAALWTIWRCQWWRTLHQPTDPMEARGS